jgi:UDP-N-acetylglucosamine 4-epimerase
VPRTYSATSRGLAAAPATWLVTGAAGFIGSNLVEALLRLGQRVVGLDNFATGYRENLEDVERAVGGAAWARFAFHEADIRDDAACARVCERVDYVLHQAALGSVPRSVNDPRTTNAVNVDGFLNMLVAARDAGVKRFVYAASSAAYGDSPALPKVEDAIGKPLSPYAVTKVVNELYARVFEDLYGIGTVGLRYFNVFGPRQDPDGAYAAVIPRWIGRVLAGERCQIYGDGETSRDFCFVDNAVEANILAALSDHPEATGNIYNIACGARTTLAELHGLINERARALRPELAIVAPEYVAERAGDVRHSHADISKAAGRLGYAPRVLVGPGLDRTVEWFARKD